jgi:ABC-type glutathione transport system ATPase component
MSAAAAPVETGKAVAGAPAHPLTVYAGDIPLIRLQGITKTYGEGTTAFQALKGVDLDIHAGDFVAIMGPSGSGKSTAMNTLGCLDRPTTGAYLFQGVRVESLSARPARAAEAPVLRLRVPGVQPAGAHLGPGERGVAADLPG